MAVLFYKYNKLSQDFKNNNNTLILRLIIKRIKIKNNNNYQ